MICVKLAVYLAMKPRLYVWFSQKTRGLALEALHKCHVQKPCSISLTSTLWTDMSEQISEYDLRIKWKTKMWFWLKRLKDHTLTLNFIVNVNKSDNELKDFCSLYIAESIKIDDDGETIWIKWRSHHLHWSLCSISERKWQPSKYYENDLTALLCVCWTSCKGHTTMDWGMNQILNWNQNQSQFMKLSLSLVSLNVKRSLECEDQDLWM